MITRTDAPTVRMPHAKTASAPVEDREILRGRTSARAASCVGIVVNGGLSGLGPRTGQGSRKLPRIGSVESPPERTDGPQVNAAGTTRAKRRTGQAHQLPTWPERAMRHPALTGPRPRVPATALAVRRAVHPAVAGASVQTAGGRRPLAERSLAVRGEGGRPWGRCRASTSGWTTPAGAAGCAAARSGCSTGPAVRCMALVWTDRSGRPADPAVPADEGRGSRRCRRPGPGSRRSPRLPVGPEPPCRPPPSSSRRTAEHDGPGVARSGQLRFFLTL